MAPRTVDWRITGETCCVCCCVCVLLNDTLDRGSGELSLALVYLVCLCREDSELPAMKPNATPFDELATMRAKHISPPFVMFMVLVSVDKKASSSSAAQLYSSFTSSLSLL